MKATPKAERNQQERAYVSLFLGYALMLGSFILADFYANTDSSREFFSTSTFLIIFVFGFLFFYRMEKNAIIISKFFISKSFIITNVVFICLFLLFDVPQLIGYGINIFWLTLFFCNYYYKLMTNEYIPNVIPHFKPKVVFYSSGMVLLAIGFVISTSLLGPLPDLLFRLIGDILQLTGAIMLFLFFIVIPPLSEYTWRDKIDRVLIMMRSGVCIYYKSFKTADSLIDEQLTSSAIKAVNILLEEITKKHGTSIIEKEKKIFIIEPREYITGVIICDEELNSLKVILTKFIEKLELFYSNIFASWNSNTKIFEPINEIAEEIFMF